MSEDKEIWHAYTRSVKPTGSLKKPFKLTIKDKANIKAQKTVATIPAISSARPDNRIVLAPIQFTKKTERSLRQGLVDIDAKLDLHGMTQMQAYAALDRFMTAEVKLGHRTLLIITGKGSLGNSILRLNLPQWLETLPVATHILDLRTAAPRHGGTGAFYIILKRRRD